MSHSVAVLMAIIPPMLWGSTYLVTTEFLPPDKALMAAVLRILPVGLLIVLFTRYRPSREQLPKLVVVSLLCMSLLHWPLFVSAYRLPGGLAAILIASQPLLVVVLGFLLFGNRITRKVAAGIIIGLIGVVMILLVPSRLEWDLIGICAAFLAAASMSLGTLLVKRWQLDIPVLAFTGWQLTIGGLLLLPFALIFDLPMAEFETGHIGGYLYLALAGTLLPYVLWFSALRKLEPVLISTLILLSPLSAMVLGYVVLDQALTVLQLAGAGAVLAGILITHVSFNNHQKQ
jgi:probable blue pigment (indigoidine) exporter